MKFESFLENLYFAKINPDQLTYSESSGSDPRVKEIIAKYKEAAKEYSDEKLDTMERIPNELLEKLKAIGFFGLSIPVEYGGVGLTLYQYLALVKEITRLDMAVGLLALAHLSIGIKAILLFGSEEQKIKYLTPAASGKMIFCYALTEPMTGSDAKNIDTQAELSDDRKYYILNGTKTFITNANYSGGLTVFAQMDKSKKGKLGVLIVETSWPGVTIGKDMSKMGLKASSTASIQFKDVRVPVENLIGQPGDGFKIAMTVLNYGRLALGAASAGMLELSYDNMLKRAKSRFQFQKPIFEFELIQEKIVHAYVEYQAVWAMTNYTATFLENNPTAYVAVESSHCKLYGTNRAWETLYEAMQLAGGSGYLKTQPYEKRMRDFRVTTIFEGTSEIHSVYPPLSMLRNLFKMLNKTSLPAVRFLRLAVLYLKSCSLKLKDTDQLIRKTLHRIKKYSLQFRRIFIRAMLVYGRNMPEQELLLRRFTDLSCRIYILLALILRIRYLRQNNQKTDDTWKSLKFLLLNSENWIKKNRSIHPSPAERFQKKIIRDL